MVKEIGYPLRKFVAPESIGSLFRVGTEYDRRELCVKEKEVPYVVAGCVSQHTNLLVPQTGLSSYPMFPQNTCNSLPRFAS